MVAEPRDRPVGTADRVSVGRQNETAVTTPPAPWRRAGGVSLIPQTPPEREFGLLRASSSEEAEVYWFRVDETAPGDGEEAEVGPLAEAPIRGVFVPDMEPQVIASLPIRIEIKDLPRIEPGVWIGGRQVVGEDD